GTGTCGAAYLTNNAVVTVTNANTFTYSNGSTSTSGNSSRNCRVSRYPYQYANQITGRPHYYTVTAKEFCTDVNLVNCAATQGGAFQVPAPVRYCSSAAD